MQEYCYKSTRRDATRAMLKLVANKLGLVYVKEGGTKRFFRRKHLRRRYLPHDPDMILEATVVADDDIIEEPITAEAMNLHPLVRQPNNVEEGCSSGFHSVSSTSQSPVDLPAAKAKAVVEEPFKEPLTKDKEDGVRKEKQNQLSSILQKMEEENAAVLERLTTLQASRNKITNSSVNQKTSTNDSVVKDCRVNQNSAVSPGQDQTLMLSQPIDSCVAMQAQLDRLKLLMEGLFGCQDSAKVPDGCETPMRSKKEILDQRKSILMELQNSLNLNDPSLIESTPVVHNLKNYHNNVTASAANKKKLSRRALDSNFSPIVFKVKIAKPKFKSGAYGLCNRNFIGTNTCH